MSAVPDTDCVQHPARNCATTLPDRALLDTLRTLGDDQTPGARAMRDATLDVLGERYPTTIGAALDAWVESGTQETQADVALRVAAELGLDELETNR